MLDELYQDIIMQAARDNSLRGSLSGTSGAFNVRLNNPLCGDSLDVWIRFENDKVSEVRFDGQGCLISQASASLFVQEIQNQSISDVQALCASFRKLVQAEPNEEELERLGQLTAFSGIRRLPSRVRCALLSCDALERLVKYQLSVLGQTERAQPSGYLAPEL